MLMNDKDIKYSHQTIGNRVLICEIIKTIVWFFMLKQRKAATSKLNDLKTKKFLFQASDRSILETIFVHDPTKDITYFAKDLEFLT